MPRPQRCRKICSEPVYTEFSPVEKNDKNFVILAYDEFEVIRLVDLEHQTHEQCAKQMEIARSTVTEIYESARHKIADSIVNGKDLRISGGNYKICDGSAKWCYKKHCRKQHMKLTNNVIGKGEHIVRIAVTYENEEIFQHFGHTEQFKLYDVEDEKVISTQIVDTNGNGHGMLAGFLSDNKVDVLICGGIGGGAKTALSDAEITLYGGVSGKADDAVNDFIAGKLAFNPNVHCSHHEHEHGEEHVCGEQGCGKEN